MEPGFIIIIAVCVLIASISHKSQVNSVGRTWGAYAQEQGLRFVPKDLFNEPEIYGEIDGRPVQVSLVKRGGKHKTTYTRVTTKALREMPQSFIVGQEGLLDAVGKVVGGQDILIGDHALDRKLRFRGASESTVVSLCDDDDLRSALRILANYTSYSKISGEEITVEQRGLMTESIAQLLSDALRIAETLDTARIRPWQDAAQQLNLALSERDTRLVLSGEHRGHTLKISADLKADTTTITLPLSGMPAGLSLVAGSKGGLTLGDPILDGMLTVSGHNPEAVRMLLQDDELRGVLLAVIHAWPGSSVTANRIMLSLPTTATEGLQERLEEVTTLASRLMRQGWYSVDQRAPQRQTDKA